MIASEKPHQNLSDFNQFLFKEIFAVNKKQIFQVKNREIQVIVYMIMLICSSEKIFNPMLYTGLLWPQS